MVQIGRQHRQVGIWGVSVRAGARSEIRCRGRSRRFGDFVLECREVKVTKTKLDGVLILEPQVFRDERGFFVETYNQQRYADVPGLDIEFVQDNHSHSTMGGLRAPHLQRTYPQGKLVRVVRGSVWDVAVDVNPHSRTFRQWVGVEITEANTLQFY